MQRTEIYADFIGVVSLNPRMTKNRYLYIVTPLELPDENPDWSGSINALKKSMQKKMGRVEKLMASEARNSKRDITQLQNQLIQLDDKVDNLKDGIEQLLKLSKK